MAKWEGLIVHCSDSSWGSIAELRKWHIEGNGWKDVGYNWDIPNGYVRPNFYIPMMDGSLEVGRRIDGDSVVSEDEVGAHARGFNNTHLSVCLFGVKMFSAKQIRMLSELSYYCMQRFDFGVNSILGHYEVDPSKTCPNIDMDVFRTSLDPQKLLRSSKEIA
jgi:hypothetical protein